MAETVVYECGHCDGKGVCERGNGGWSCHTCIHSAGYNPDPLFKKEWHKAVKCSICGGSGKIVKIVR